MINFSAAAWNRFSLCTDLGATEPAGYGLDTCCFWNSWLGLRKCFLVNWEMHLCLVISMLYILSWFHQHYSLNYAIKNSLKLWRPIEGYLHGNRKPTWWNHWRFTNLNQISKISRLPLGSNPKTDQLKPELIDCLTLEPPKPSGNIMVLLHSSMGHEHETWSNLLASIFESWADLKEFKLHKIHSVTSGAIKPLQRVGQNST